MTLHNDERIKKKEKESRGEICAVLPPSKQEEEEEEEENLERKRERERESDDEDNFKRPKRKNKFVLH